MFIGEYKYILDEKGRIVIPARFRDDLKDGAVITRGLDYSLFLYSMDQWKELAQKLIKLPFGQKDNRAFARLMLSGAMEVMPDKQGRIIVPDYLMEYAKLDKKIVIAGLYDRVEIWDQGRWLVYKAEAEKNSDQIAERLAEL